MLTHRYDLESRYATRVLTTHNAWPWMVRWAAFLRSRFGAKANGRTAYQDAFETSYVSEILPFGETAINQQDRGRAGKAQAAQRGQPVAQGHFAGKEREHQ